MRKLIKTVTILLVLLLTLSFSMACGGNDDIDNGTTPPTHVCDENCTYTITEWFDNYRHYPKALKCNVDESVTISRTKIEISSADEFMTLAEDLIARNFIGTTEVLFTKDIDMAGKTWTPIDFRITKNSDYDGTVLSFDGNGKTIKNLATSDNYLSSAGIFGEVSGNVGFTFKNLTLDSAKIIGDLEDSNAEPNQKGVGAFIGLPKGLLGNVTITNCAVKNSEIKGAHWAGGFLGYICKETATTTIDTGKILVNISNSTIENSSVVSQGSAGGIVGHAGGCVNVKMTATGVTVKNVTINSQGSSKIKAGSFVGTVGLAQITITNSIFLDNSVISNGQKNVDRVYYGRFGGEFDAEYGRLSVNGTTITPHEN